MADKVIKPCGSLKGTIALPGDKSISHRALIMAALAEGTSTITGLSTAEDVGRTRACLEELGVSIEDEEGAVVVKGVGLNGLKAPKKTLDAGNSGTTMRLLAGVLAAQNFTSTIDGDDSLRKRPMRRIIEPLEQMGAEVESNDYKAPLTIHGNKLRAIDYASPIASAQVKSCILLAGLYARGLTRVTEPMQSRDHTERMLIEFGVKAHSAEGMAAVKGPGLLTATNIDVPADISSAAFFLAGACLLPGSDVKLVNVGINPTRTGILDAFFSMGVLIGKEEEAEQNHEPRATLTASGQKLHSTQLGGAIIPRIIDEIPILAVAASQADGTTVIRDATELRYKESDRITAIVENLKKMGARIRETKDGFVVEGPSKLKGAEINSNGDHRIAMAFTIAGLIAEGETVIKDVDCVNTSFPAFYDTLEKLCSD